MYTFVLYSLVRNLDTGDKSGWSSFYLSPGISLVMTKVTPINLLASPRRLV